MATEAAAACPGAEPASPAVDLGIDLQGGTEGVVAADFGGALDGGLGLNGETSAIEQVMRGKSSACAQCGTLTSMLFADEGDGAAYCAPCWGAYYAMLDAQESEMPGD